MNIRASLLAGIALPFALVTPSLAEEATRAPTAAIILAQAEEACPEGTECAPAAEQGETRRERRARRRAEREAQGQAAPAEQAAPAQAEPEQPAAQEGESRRERRARLRAEREAQGQAAPAEQAAPAAAPEQPAAEQGETPRQRRARLRAEREAQGQAAPAEQAAPAAAPEQPAAEQGETRAERRARRRAEREAQGQPAPAEQAAPAQAEPEQPAAEQGETRRQRRARLRAEREAQGQAAPAEQAAPAAAPEQPSAAEQESRRERRARRRAQRERQEQRAAEENRAAATQPAPAPAEAGEASATERQLEAQGDRAEADRVRRLRQKLRAQRREVRELRQEDRQEDRAEQREDQAERREDRQERREDRREARRGERILERRGDRIVVDLGGGRIVVRSDFEDESERLLYGARDVEVIELDNGRTRTIVYREDGSQVVTVRNRYGDIVRRVRRYPDNREVVLIEDIYVDREVPVIYEPIRLPPLVVSVPEEEYIVDYAEATPEEIQEVLVAPPVERVERPYSVQEVTTNVRVRDKMSRIDLDAITFEFGSATIGPDQTDALDELGFAMEEVIAANPEEVYLIEGHTDAVGSDADNLLLSDDRAEAVAVALSQNFEIPAENLVTEGYGEEYLKVPTEGPERQNRRVTVRRITPLLAAEAQQ